MSVLTLTLDSPLDNTYIRILSKRWMDIYNACAKGSSEVKIPFVSRWRHTHSTAFCYSTYITPMTSPYHVYVQRCVIDE